MESLGFERKHEGSLSTTSTDFLLLYGYKPAREPGEMSLDENDRAF